MTKIAESNTTEIAGDDRKGVQSVDRAFDLMRVFERSDRPLGIKELALSTGMTPSQVHHYLVSLTRSEAISQRPDGLYELGVLSLQLGLTALRRLDPIQCAFDTARALRDATGQVTLVTVWGSHGPTVLRQFTGFQSVCVDVRAGQTLPVVGSATGHVFLTWLEDQTTAFFVTKEKAPDVPSIKVGTRDAGLGFMRGAISPLVSSLAVPAFDQEGRLAFCLASLGWSDEFDGSLNGDVAQQLKEAGAALSASLGYVTA